MQIHEFPGRYCIYARSHLLTKASTVGGEKKLSRKGWRVERSRRERERKRERKRHVFFTLFLVDDVLTQKEKRKEKGIRGIRRLKGNVTVCGLHYKMAGDAERGEGTDIADYLRDVLFYEPDRTYRMCPFFFSLSFFLPFDHLNHRRIRRSTPFLETLLVAAIINLYRLPDLYYLYHLYRSLTYTMVFLSRPKVYSSLPRWTLDKLWTVPLEGEQVFKAFSLLDYFTTCDHMCRVIRWYDESEMKMMKNYFSFLFANYFRKYFRGYLPRSCTSWEWRRKDFTIDFSKKKKSFISRLLKRKRKNRRGEEIS